MAEFNGRKFEDFGPLRDALTEAGKTASDSRVILDVAGNVPLGDVIFVYDACRAARFHSVNFAATPEEVAAGPQARLAARSAQEITW